MTELGEEVTKRAVLTVTAVASVSFAVLAVVLGLFTLVALGLHVGVAFVAAAAAVAEVNFDAWNVRKRIRSIFPFVLSVLVAVLLTIVGGTSADVIGVIAASPVAKETGFIIAVIVAYTPGHAGRIRVSCPNAFVQGGLGVLAGGVIGMIAGLPVTLLVGIGDVIGAVAGTLAAVMLVLVSIRLRYAVVDWVRPRYIRDNILRALWEDSRGLTRFEIELRSGLSGLAAEGIDNELDYLLKKGMVVTSGPRFLLSKTGREHLERNTSSSF